MTEQKQNLTLLDAQIGTLIATGHSSREISPIVGLAHNTICNHAKKPEVKAFIESLATELALKTASTIVDNHVQAIQSANKAWHLIASQNNPLDAAATASLSKDLIEMSDKKEKRIGQSLGLFPSPAPSILMQQIFTGPTNLILGPQVSAMLGAVTRDPADEDDQGDIVDL